jgi:hypothetical protein
MTKEGKVAAVCFVVVVSTALVLLVPWLRWCLVGGALLWSLGIAVRAGWRGWASARLTQAEIATAEADAREAHARADLKREEVEAAKVRRHLIPADYIGAQLRQVDERGLYHVWLQPGTINNYGAEVEALPLALPRAEAFATIVYEITPGHLILGYNLAGKIRGDLTDLLSTAIVGRPGTGKTTALRFVCAQLLKIGGRPILFDPHGSIADEVGDLLECAEDGSEMTRLAAQLEGELNMRLHLRKLKQPWGKPLLLLADEWPLISQLSDEAVRVGGRIVLEGRKVDMYALISGQGLPSEQLGGSLVRDALSSRYVFNTTAQQARMAGLDNETAKLLTAQLDTAGPGYAILASATRRAEIIAVPNTTVGDLRALADDYPRLPPLPPNPNRVCVDAEQPPEASKVAPAYTHTHKVTPEQRAYILLHRADMSPSAIAVMLWNDAHKNIVVRQVWQEEGS